MKIPTISDGIDARQSGLHSQSSTNIDLLTVLKSSKNSVYVPFLNERDHLGHLVSKKSNKSLNKSLTSLNNINVQIQQSGEFKTANSGVFSIDIQSSKKTLIEGSRSNSKTNLEAGQSASSMKRFKPQNSLVIDTTFLNENAKVLKQIDRAARDLANGKLTRNSTLTMP